jgi:hypothetical protein
MDYVRMSELLLLVCTHQCELCLPPNACLGESSLVGGRNVWEVCSGTSHHPTPTLNA